ncbi:MAG: hypothetical protein ACU4EQ_04535 [Candidatus Nitrosoglobus sp.]
MKHIIRIVIGLGLSFSAQANWLDGDWTLSVLQEVQLASPSGPPHGGGHHGGGWHHGGGHHGGGWNHGGGHHGNQGGGQGLFQISQQVQISPTGAIQISQVAQAQGGASGSGMQVVTISHHAK